MKKRKIGRVAMVVMGLFLAAGMIFCIVRPSYVKEAVGILLNNELSIEHEEDSAADEGDSGTGSEPADSSQPETE